MVSNRIIAFCLTAVTLFSSVSSASAAEASNAATFANGSFWDQMLIGLVKGTAEWPFGDIVQDVAAVVSGEVCPDSSDGLHRTSRAGLLGRPAGFDAGFGRYGVALCDHCGEEFKLYAQDLSERGRGFVDSLPTSVVSPQYESSYTVSGAWVISTPRPDVYIGSWSAKEVVSGTIFVDNTSYVLTHVWGMYGKPQFCHSSGYFDVEYDRIVRRRNDGYYSDTDVFSSITVDFGSVQTLSPDFYKWLLDNTSMPGIYVGSPDTESTPVSSRPTSITGNYGIIGDDGSLTKIDSTTIVNEGSSTYYNPITNTSYDLSGWTYDYSTRTYNLTTADDNSVTVTYGDENVTINEGDTTYNVYYLVESPSTDDGSGSGDPGTGEDHTHDYTSEITTAASCLLPGVRTYTCSCGDTYTKSIPATGHAWAISQQVNTTYDPDTGELLQQGYTVYVCNTCGEQYKDEAGTGPPNGSSGDSEGEGIWDKIGKLIGTIFDGILGLIEGVLGGLLDGLISLATMISDKLAQVVDVIMSLFQEIPAMFTGFLDFLSAVFPFIPEEMMTLLTFGLAAVIFIGILGWFRR